MVQIPTAFIVIGGYTVIVGITLSLSRHIEISRAMMQDIHSFVP